MNYFLERVEYKSHGLGEIESRSECRYAVRSSLVMD